jgi:hydrogenase maturation protease
LRYLIGIGNFSRADDGIGLRLIERVVEAGLDRGFEAVNLADEGLRLLFYLHEGTEKIVIVDAVEMGLPPGEYRLFRPEDVASTKETKRLTTHESDILAILDFARSLGYRLPPITILGIQPGDLGPCPELSPALRERFDIYLGAALDEVAKAASGASHK